MAKRKSYKWAETETMKNLFTLFGGISKAVTNPARVILADEVEGVCVSTVDSYDLGPETAILDANGIHPVERYKSLASAREGHAKWVAWANDRKNKSVKKLGYLGIVSDGEITLKRRQENGRE